MDSTGSPSPIPFYGGKQPEMFEIERRCMDREGVVTSYLQEHLPKGSDFTLAKRRQLL